jgi:hypothetical protein
LNACGIHTRNAPSGGPGCGIGEKEKKDALKTFRCAAPIYFFVFFVFWSIVTNTFYYKKTQRNPINVCAHLPSCQLGQTIHTFPVAKLSISQQFKIINVVAHRACLFYIYNATIGPLLTFFSVFLKKHQFLRKKP